VNKYFFFLGLLIAARFPAIAQDGHHWLRDTKSGKVELSGELPWPKAVKTDTQKLSLIRYWYLAKLTDVKPNELTGWLKEEGSTYGVLPRKGYFDYVSYRNDEEHFRLLYQIDLTPTKTGLAYRLSNFEYEYFSVDVGGGDRLEDLLAHYPTGRPELSVFQWRLLLALSGW
jgi:hypothetical protein